MRSAAMLGIGTCLFGLAFASAGRPAGETDGLAGGTAQQRATKGRPVFAEETELVAVPVFVTDRSGRAVPHLSKEDFGVWDEGKRVEVKAFIAIDAGAAEPPPATSRAVALTELRQFLLLFDLSFTTPEALHAAQQAAMDFVAGSLGPSDLAGVATVGGGILRLVVGLTTDRRQLSEGIATLGVARAERLRDPLGLAYDMHMDPLEPTGTYGLMIRDDDQWLKEVLGLDIRDYGVRGQYTQHVVDLLKGLAGLSALLDNLHGRKQVIFFSAGFKAGTLTPVTGAERDKENRAITEGRPWDVHSDQHFGDASALAIFAELMKSLKRTDTVLHTVDVMGLVSRAPGIEWQTAVQPELGRESLAHLAAGSGGIFVRETNDLSQALADILKATRYYYVLGFEPARKSKRGKLRRLKIHVDRDGLHVSHRRGYVLPDPDEKQSAPARQLQAAQLVTSGVSGGEIGVSAVAVPYRSTDGKPCLPVVVGVDGPSLLAEAGRQQRRVEVYVYALDGRGRILDALALRPMLQLGKVGELVRASGMQILTSLRVSEGPTDLRVLVRDTETGRTGLYATRVAVPAFSPKSVYLTPPLLMEDPTTRLAIPAASQARPTLSLPFRVGQRPFTVDTTGRLRNGETREVCALSWQGDGAARGPVTRVTSRLVGPAGNFPLATSARSEKDADGFTRLVLDEAPRGVPPGDYELNVEVEFAEGGASRSSGLVHVE